ncbi:MAG: universal stress protein [Bacteroidota bacterium]|jgi:nucleotide-binding universal stress UspA family protein
MKILIPTDFSKLSKVAVNYAAKMAMEFDAELVLLNVVFLDAPPRASMSLKSVEEVMRNNAEIDSVQLISELKVQYKGRLNITHKIIMGNLVEDIVENYAVHNSIDLIIMGTKGATGLEKYIIGSNAAGVVSNSSIPVITVPEHARFNGLKHIVYATDMWDLNIEAKALVPLAQLFNSTIHIVHIIEPNSKKNIEIKTITTDLISELNYTKIKFKVVINDDIINGIDEYIADIKADMLAMFTRELTFFEKLFGKSVTRQMAFHSWIPMISFKKTWA